jgi:hypothetical protein
MTGLSTGRTFNTRYEYKEHIHGIRSNNSNTGYSNSILNTGHIWDNNRHHGNHNNREEGKIFEIIRKVL